MPKKKSKMPLLKKLRFSIGSMRHMAANERRDRLLGGFLLATPSQWLGASSALLPLVRPVNTTVGPVCLPFYLCVVFKKLKYVSALHSVIVSLLFSAFGQKYAKALLINVGTSFVSAPCLLEGSPVISRFFCAFVCHRLLLQVSFVSHPRRFFMMSNGEFHWESKSGETAFKSD